MISIANAPRDAAALSQLKRRQLYLLATNLKLLSDDQRESAFLAMSPEQQAGTVLQGLQAMDAAGGAPVEAAPVAAAPPPQAVPQPAPQPVPQAVAPPPAPAPVAPPPAAPMAAPQMPQAPMPAQPMAAPPPVAMPPTPMAPPQAPQMPVAAPQMPVAPPPAVAAPPAPAPVPMAPAAPAPPPQPAMPPQAPPAPQPPPQRQPQTATDPGGPAPQLSQLVTILTEMNTGQTKLAAGIDALSKNVNGSVLLQKVILQILLTLAELQGMDADSLIKQVKLGDADAVEKFIGALGTSQGKS